MEITRLSIHQRKLYRFPVSFTLVIPVSCLFVRNRLGGPLRATPSDGQQAQEYEVPKHRQDHCKCQPRTEEASTDRADWLVVGSIRQGDRCACLSGRSRQGTTASVLCVVANSTPSGGRVDQSGVDVIDEARKRDVASATEEVVGDKVCSGSVLKIESYYRFTARRRLANFQSYGRRVGD